MSAEAQQFSPNDGDVQVGPDEVMRSEPFGALVDRIAAESGRTKKSVREEVDECLKEMATVPSVTSTSKILFQRLGKWMSRAYTVDLDENGLKEIRELGKNASLIFLPNHRSYLDPIILRSQLKKHGFPDNYVLGGVNLAFWPMSGLAKRNGIVFIRREFKNDQVYKATLRTYLAYLMQNKCNLEWYIEGGRSRSGKLRPPRYGILSYVVDAFTAADDETVYIIPVSINYDQQHEIGAISAEELGASKSPESVSWLVRYARAQSRGMGRVHLRFGKPLSLADAVESVRRQEVDKAEAKGEPPPEDLDRYVVPKIAFEVAYRINQVTPISSTSLVTFALLDNDDCSITLEQGRSILRPLLDYIAIRGLPLTPDVDLGDTGGVAEALANLVREGVVSRYDGGLDPVFAISDDRQHEAGFYRNTVIHFFITRAIVEVALVKMGEEDATDVSAATWDYCKRLRDLLKYEFFFPSTREFSDAVEREVAIVRPNWEAERDDFDAKRTLRILRDSKLHLAHRVIGPFLEAYEVVALQLAAREPSRPIDRDSFIAECLGVGRQWWLQGKLHSPESISKELFSGALQLAGNRGLIESGTEDLRRRREEFAAELTEAVRLVQVVRGMALHDERKAAREAEK